MEPLVGHVGRRQRDDAAPGQGVGIGLGDGADVGEHVELAVDLDGVRGGGVLPAAEDLAHHRALAVVGHQLDLAAVELEVLVEPVGEHAQGALHALGRVRLEVHRRHLLDHAGVVGVGGDPVGHADRVGADAPAGGPAVVAVEGEARRRVRALGDLQLTVRARFDVTGDRLALGAGGREPAGGGGDRRARRQQRHDEGHDHDADHDGQVAAQDPALGRRAHAERSARSATAGDDAR
ncbi:MAG: hypothetical protein R2699_11465 [Acidimicrobiales bacterium]